MQNSFEVDENDDMVSLFTETLQFPYRFAVWGYQGKISDSQITGGKNFFTIICFFMVRLLLILFLVDGINFFFRSQI